MDLDPIAGQFLIEDLAWGSYTITETQTPDHHSGSASFTFTVDASTAGSVIDRGDQVNDRDLGALTWTKVDETGAPLGGTTWRVDGDELAQPIEVTDCVAASASACQDADLDPAEGGFHISDLPWGDYELTEVAAADGYFLLTDPIPFTIQPGSGLEVDLGQIANHPIVYPEIPLTGGTSHLVFIGGGLGAGLVALGLHAVGSLRRRG